MSSLLISVQNLSKKFGAVQALGGVSFEIFAGMRFGIVGADGAGKSTCLRVLVGLEKADTGLINLLGSDVQNFSPDLRKQMGWMPQRFSLYSDLSVGENLDFYGRLFGLSSKERFRRSQELLEFVHLDAFVNRKAQALSGGMKQKLALSCAMIHRPQILLLDEPTVGVDPVSRQDFRLLLDEIQRQGLTVVMSTPYMDEGEACDQVALFHEGQILACASPQKMALELPTQLWELHFDNIQHFGMDWSLPNGIELIYPMNGRLRVFCPLSIERSDLELKLRSLFSESFQIQAVPAGLEDVLIWNLRRSR